jgi:hypothetical protein
MAELGADEATINQWTAVETPDELEIYPENWQAVQLFSSCQTQWRTSMAGITGMDYNAVKIVMDSMDIEDKEVFRKLQIIEFSALNETRN